MARPLRVEFQGAWYHVMNRGAGRRRTFFARRDFLRFLDLLGDASAVFNLEVHAYCLMGNHYHLLVRTPDGGLGRAMRHLNGVYTQYINRRRERDGSLFRGRYRAILVDSGSYLLQVSRYIHLNPVDAGIVERPESYPYTSYGFYVEPRAARDASTRRPVHFTRAARSSRSSEGNHSRPPSERVPQPRDSPTIARFPTRAASYRGQVCPP